MRPLMERVLSRREILGAEDSGLETGADAHLRTVLEFFDLKRHGIKVGTALLDILSRRYPFVDEMIRRNGERTSMTLLSFQDI